MRLLRWLILAVAVAIGAGWVLTRPVSLSEEDLAGIEADPVKGELVFHAAGCASCHAGDGAEGDAKLVLKGGKRFATPVGTFVAPNISQDETHGIGGWSRAEVVTAITEGTSPDGRHYFPAFPYAAYGKAELGDIVHLAAYLETLPADPTPSEPHDIGFPFNIRAGVGAWKMLNVSEEYAVDLGGSEQVQRGQYLAETLGHCGECHTPRTLAQGLDTGSWLAGAPNPSGKGNIPNITPGKLDWSETDIASYLETGFTPEYDVVGGSMTAVVEELAKLPTEDREALAAYLKAVPPVQ